MPQETYNLISETLSVDASSKAFDRNLREEISEAHRTMASGMTTLPNIAIPVEALLNTMLPDAYTAI